MEEVEAERSIRSVHREPRRPQGRPHSPRLDTAPLKRLEQMAMVLTCQKPMQRCRFGEAPEDLPGSTKSVVCVERSVRNLGSPVNSWASNSGRPNRQQKGRPMVCRVADQPVVLGDGSADHKGKGLTGIRSLQRKHEPGVKDWI